MRRASHNQNLLRSRKSAKHSAGEPVRPKVAESRRHADAHASRADQPVSEIRLSPSGTFAKSNEIEPDARSERHRQLAIAIRQRIESRLPGRVRNLAVRILRDTVVL